MKPGKCARRDAGRTGILGVKTVRESAVCDATVSFNRFAQANGRTEEIDTEMEALLTEFMGRMKQQLDDPGFKSKQEEDSWQAFVERMEERRVRHGFDNYWQALSIAIEWRAYFERPLPENYLHSRDYQRLRQQIERHKNILGTCAYPDCRMPVRESQAHRVSPEGYVYHEDCCWQTLGDEIARKGDPLMAVAGPA